MEFSVKKEGGLIKALKAANSGYNPKENIVILDMDCDKTVNTGDDSDTAFDYIRIKGASGVKRTIKNYGFQCKGDIYLQDINVETNVDAGPDTFIRWNYATDSGYNGIPNSSVYIDRVNVKGYRRFVMEPDPNDNSVKSLFKIRMKHCTFKNCYGSMLTLYSRCDDAKVYGNTYIEPHVIDYDTCTHNLVTLGSSRSQSNGTYSRYPINNVEIFDNVMIGTFEKITKELDETTGEITETKEMSRKNIYYGVDDIEGDKTTYGVESHMCCLHGDNLYVHDNLYRDWEMIDKAKKIDPEPIYVKGSNVRVINNVIENCTMGEGAIIFKGSYGDIEISHNRINPGYDVEQRAFYKSKIETEDLNENGTQDPYLHQTDSTFALIQLQSLGGASLVESEKPSTVKVKITSNHLTYKRKSTKRTHKYNTTNGKEVSYPTYQNCKSAIFFNSIGADQYDPFIDIECSDNYYEGMDDFIRCSQRSKDVNLLVDNNTVITTGSIPWLNADECKKSSDCTTALVTTGVSNFDNNLTLTIKNNKGNVGAVLLNEFLAPSSDNKMSSKIVILNNELTVNRVILSTQRGNLPVAGKNISIEINSNKFRMAGKEEIKLETGKSNYEFDFGYVGNVKTDTLRSSNGVLLVVGNIFEYLEKFKPQHTFLSTTDSERGLICKKITVENNDFYNTGFSNVENCVLSNAPNQGNLNSNVIFYVESSDISESNNDFE